MLFLNGLLYGLLYGAYSTLLNLSGYSTVRLLNILLISIIVKILFIAVAFILTIKILNKNNKELVQNNISKLITATVLLQLILGTLFAFFYLNSSNISSTYHTPFYVYIVLICFFNYVYLNIIYSVFILKKRRKIFVAITLLLVVSYTANFYLYRINFNKNYKNADIQEDFYLYPTININNITGYSFDRNGNSATKFIELINNLNNRKQQKDDTEVSAFNYIIPSEGDLEVLRLLNQAGYLSLSEEYMPDDIILYRNSMIVPLNNLRAFSRGIIKLTDEQISHNQFSQAKENLYQLLLFGDQLIRDKDDGLIVKLVGISIAKLSGEKLIELNQNVEVLEKYLRELDEIKNNSSALVKLELNVSHEFFGSKNAALYFKFLDKYSDIISPDPVIKYSFYNMDMPTMWQGAGFIGFLEERGPSIGESLLSMAGGVLIKINVGKNYTFYNKAVELQKKNGSEEFNFYIDNNTLSIIKRYGAEVSEVSEIQDNIILK